MAALAKTKPARIYVKLNYFKDEKDKADKQPVETPDQEKQANSKSNSLDKTLDNDCESQRDSASRSDHDKANTMELKRNDKKIPVYYPTRSSIKEAGNQGKGLPPILISPAIESQPSEEVSSNPTDKNKLLGESTDHPVLGIEDTDACGISETDFICIVCEKRCRSKRGLSYHMRTHENGDMKVCKVCGDICKDQISLYLHMVSHPPEPTTCDICGKTYKHPEYLRRHKTGHFVEYQCEVCAKTFRTKSGLSKHENINHFNQPPALCSLCGNSFKTSYGLKRHMTINKHPTMLKCNYCSKTFKWEQNRKDHMRIHEGRGLFKCQECGKEFLNDQSLQRHILSHTGELPFQCEICGLKLKRGWNLKLHMRLRHGIGPAFKCEACGKSFVSSHRFDEHVCVRRPRHRGPVVRRRKCDQCGKLFDTPSRLLIHQRSHSGERPYKCDSCGKSFTNKSHLKRHEAKVHGIGEGKIASLSSISDKKSAQRYMRPVTESATISDEMIHGNQIAQLSMFKSEPIDHYLLQNDIISYEYLAEPLSQNLHLHNETLDQSMTFSSLEKPLVNTEADKAKEVVLFDKSDIRTGVKVMLKGVPK